jgi:multidrug efflux pump subunit AcrB
VRNSIILVDFVELKLRQGMPLEQAVAEAGAVLFRPMLLTAAAAVVGNYLIARGGRAEALRGESPPALRPAPSAVELPATAA